MSDKMFGRLLLAMCLGAIFVGVCIGFAADSKGADVKYPIGEMTEDAGIIFNRKGPKNVGPPRTEPVQPQPAAPVFEAIPPTAPAVAVTVDPAAPCVGGNCPAVGGGSVGPSVVDEPVKSAALTPEQKTALKGLIVQIATLLIGSFLGSGGATPFMKTILEKLLGMVSGANPATPPATVPARLRAKRVAKAAKKTA